MQSGLLELLSQCKCGHGGGGGLGRVQWDPARDLLTSEKGEPRKMLRARAIQIGLKGKLSKLYVSKIVSIEDVTLLAIKVGLAHKDKQVSERMEEILCELPNERPYSPACTEEVLINLKLEP